MSGDVQPRKRKDKKRKKDELGVEEPRGTSAVFGEGDVLMHSHHDHGTGGHWCAKLIFFSLLSVLIILIGLIILENRGLTELEANAVESRYSGVLEGWLEDAPEEDHHDGHTLELKHPDVEEEDHDNEDEELDHGDDDDEIDHDEDDEIDHNEDDETDHDEDDDDDDHDEENELEDDEDDVDGNQDDDNDDDYEEDQVDDQQEDSENSEERQIQDNDDDDEVEDDEIVYRKYFNDKEEQSQENDDDKNDSNEGDLRRVEDSDIGENDDRSEEDDDDAIDTDLYNYNENEQNDNDDGQANDQSLEGGNDTADNNENDEDDDIHEIEHDNEEETDHTPDDEEEKEIEVEKIEKEVSDEALSAEAPTPFDSDVEDTVEEIANDFEIPDEDENDEEEFLEPDDVDDLPEADHIPTPRGKPLVEVEEESFSEKPLDTLKDEEEYEKQQEELRREQEQESHKDGGNSIDDEWPGEPSDSYWREELDQAERELQKGEWTAAEARASAEQLQSSARARWIVARAVDGSAEARRDNRLLSRAITAYLHLCKMHERLSNKRLLEITKRALNRIQFRGSYLSAEPVYRILIRRFPNEPAHRNSLAISFLMANRIDLAEGVLNETLKLWPDDRVALAHYGFILKTHHKRYEEAVDAFKKALEGDTDSPANEARFYYHWGDSLLLLGRNAEAHEVHKRGAELRHFLSPAQRSLYNVGRLKSSPWWKIEDTPYTNLARSLENSWKDILKEGEALSAIYEKEKEGLKERGEWSQLDLFVRGQEIPGRCKKAPVTCSIVRKEIAAAGCKRGQIKFSSMEAGTHVRAHVGPTNCRLRMHLGLSNTKDTYLRVDQETRQWQVGKVLLFDDSFEHEVWHNGTGTRLVLIVDVWHPDLSQAQRQQLAPI